MVHPIVALLFQFVNSSTFFNTFSDHEVRQNVLFLRRNGHFICINLIKSIRLPRYHERLKKMQTKTRQNNIFPLGKRPGLIYQFVYAIKRTRAEDDICGMFLLCSCQLFTKCSQQWPMYKINLKGEF